jgi:spermidine/putrescine transport system permease protein
VSAAVAEASVPVRESGRRLPRPLTALGALPLGAWMLLFFLLPFVLIVWYSFGEKPDLYTTHSNATLSFARYGEALSPTFLTIFLRTLRIAVIGTVLSLVIAFPMAYWMAAVVRPGRRGLILGLVLVPYWTNFLVRTLGWQVILGGDGVLSHLLQRMGITDAPLQIINTPAAVQIGVVYNYLPLMILPIYVALERIDGSLLEASRDLGAGAFATFRSVTVPLALPGVVGGLLLVFVPLMGDYITPSVLGGASGSMVAQMVASQFTNAQNWALGSAMAILLMLSIFGVTACAAGVLSALGWLVRRPARLRLGGGAA